MPEATGRDGGPGGPAREHAGPASERPEDAFRIRLRYGDRWLEADRPPGIGWSHALRRSPVASGTQGPDGEDAAPGHVPAREPGSHAHPHGIAGLDRLLDTPTAGPSFETVLGGARRIGIVLPDRTRAAGAPELLPVLLNRIAGDDGRARRGGTLPAGGAERQDAGLAGGAGREVVGFVGGGSHAPGDTEYLRAAIPEGWRDSFRFVIHDAREDAALATFGKTSRGTPIVMNRALREVDALVVLGGIGYHYFAGFTGGRKGIFPGLGGYESIRMNHSLTLDPVPGRGLHPGCRPGNLEGNPVHEDALEAARLVGVPIFLVNTLLGEEGAVQDLVTGDLDAAHVEGCRRYAADHRGRVPADADLVVADAGGHPRDIDLIQAHKSLAHLAPIVRDGATVIFAARCPEGVGSRTFLHWFDHGDAAAMERALRADYQLNSHTALSFRKLSERARILMVTDLEPAIVERTGAEPCSSLEEALARAVGGGKGSGIGIVVNSPASVLLATESRAS